MMLVMMVMKTITMVMEAIMKTIADVPYR